MTKIMCNILVGSAIVIWLLTSFSNALAHGGGQLQVGPVATGPYQVSVWTAPPTPRVNRDLHVTVAVGDGLTNEPVLDATVTVTIYRLGQETAVVTKPVLAEFATNRLFYETDLRLAQEGEYRVVVDVAGVKGEGQAAFIITMSPPSPLNWLYVLLAVSGAGWLYYIWRKRPTVAAPVRPRRGNMFHARCPTYPTYYVHQLPGNGRFHPLPHG
jgi:hypothetical protein